MGVDIFRADKEPQGRHTQAVDDRGGKTEHGSLPPVEKPGAWDGKEHGEDQGDPLHIAHHVRGEAQIVDHVVANVGKIHVKGNEEHRQGQIDPGKLPVLKIAAKIENAEKLTGEASPAAGLQVGAVRHGKKAVDAKGDDHKAHDEEEPHVVVVAAHQNAPQHGANNGADDGLGGEGRSQLTPVAVVHVVVYPGVQADVVAHGAEEAHNGVRGHHGKAHRGEGRGGTAGQKLGHSEGNGKDAPEDVPHGYQKLPLSQPVGNAAEEKGGDGGCRGGHPHHPGNDGGILGDLGVDKGVEPLVFHIPAELSRDAQAPHQEPEIQIGSFLGLHCVLPPGVCQKSEDG